MSHARTVGRGTPSVAACPDGEGPPVGGNCAAVSRRGHRSGGPPGALTAPITRRQSRGTPTINQEAGGSSLPGPALLVVARLPRPQGRISSQGKDYTRRATDVLVSPTRNSTPRRSSLAPGMMTAPGGGAKCFRFARSPIGPPRRCSLFSTAAHTWSATSSKARRQFLQYTSRTSMRTPDSLVRNDPRKSACLAVLKSRSTCAAPVQR